MKENQDQIGLFDDYLLNRMTSGERFAFEEKLDSDNDLKIEFNTHALLVSAIKESGKDELKAHLKANFKKPATLVVSKWIYASAAVILLFGCLYFINNSQRLDISQEKTNPEAIAEPVKPDTIIPENKEEIVLNENKEKANAIMEEVEASPAPIMMDDRADNDMPMANNSPADGKMTVNKEEMRSEEFSPDVFSDRKTYDTTLAVNNIYSATVFTNSQYSLNKDVVKKPGEKQLEEKAKPSSVERKKSKSDVDDNNNPDKYKVEEWESPVNFKGYNFTDGTIKIFSIKLDHIVEYNLNLYLKSKEGSWYLINQTVKFLPLNEVTDQTIKTILENK
ncbi:MAG: hypothetical protein H7321_01125 [Bacteroidia bacterium]|nr:hypothetical protein [Bacteroidia bacterium]